MELMLVGKEPSSEMSLFFDCLSIRRRLVDIEDGLKIALVCLRTNGCPPLSKENVEVLAMPQALSHVNSAAR